MLARPTADANAGPTLESGTSPQAPCAADPKRLRDVAGAFGMTDPRSFPFTFGVEEEFFLTHPRSRSLALQVPHSLLRACRRRFGDAVVPELLWSQIEVVSPVFERHEQAVQEMERLRRGVAEIATEKGFRLVAAGTHPIAAWGEQIETPKRRYRAIMDDFQIVARRNVLCGLHVHVAVPPGVDRVVLMNRVMHWLPVFLALSTSSPFWNRSPTGLLSYRQAAYDEWPRTGIPDHFRDEPEYDRFAGLLAAAGAVKDASFLWWAIRPALRYPTLELRICDTCTRLEDSLAIAALYRCVVRLLVRRPDYAPDWTPFTRRLIDENRWRAKRHGTDAAFLSFDGSASRPCKDVVNDLLADVAEDAERLQCAEALQRIRSIFTEGTSAHVQMKRYREVRGRGDTMAKALQSVVDWLIETTVPSA
jgi:carboxylate-amine ligase